MRKLLSWLTGKRAPQPKPKPADETPELPARDNVSFALDLYLRLKDTVGPYENVVCSPFGVATALALVQAGARGRTADQLTRLLEGTAAKAQWQTELRAWRARLIEGARQDEYLLETATGLWGPRDAPLRNEFSEAVGRSCGADVRQADFSQEETARTSINRWLGERARQLFHAVAARDEITPEARLVLINALCFKGLWAAPFGIQQTLDESFWVNPHTKIVVPMMWQRGTFPYRQFPFHFADRVQVLELPYAGVELSMVLLLPEGIEGILELEHTLQREKGKRLNGWLQALEPREVDVTVPKFTVGSRFNCGDTLIEMGLADAFSQDDADFAGMRPKRDLFLSYVFHQALVAIDEFGATDGATASAGDSATRKTGGAAGRPVPMFRADHPFLFLIREQASGQIAFMGRVMYPPVVPKFNPAL